MKYYYVILGSNLDYYKICYKDLEKIDYAKYVCSDIYGNKFQKMLYRIHNSEKINNIIKIPGKSIWFKKMLNINVKIPVCFVFFTNTKKFESIEYGYIDFLKKEYPNSKFVCFYQDIVALKRKLDIEKVKELFDIVISFDKKDCEKYKLLYYPDVYSKYEIKENKIDIDVYFVGRAKDRLLELYKVYDLLEKKGCKCKFKLIGVPEKKRIQREGIEYFDKNISYLQIIKDIQKSYAILEIMQGGAVGYTLRTCEAIAYDKLLITNNIEIKNADFYDKDNIKIIIPDKYEEITLNEIRTEHKFSQDIKSNLSPINFLHFIDERLEL